MSGEHIACVNGEEKRLTELVLSMTSSLIGRLVFSIVFFALGDLIISKTIKSARPMGRFAFGLIYLFCLTIISSLPALWAVIAAVDVDVATTAYLAVTVVVMIILAYSARRRSIDAYNNSKNALFSIIPLLNLLLIFKGPHNPRTTKRTWVATTGRFAVFAVLAPAVMVPGMIIQGVGEASARTPNFLNMPLQRAINLSAQITESQAPLIIDEVTILMGANVDHLDLTYEYKITGDVESTPPEIFRNLQSEYVRTAVCGDPLFMQIVGNAGTVTFAYTLETEVVAISVRNC